MLRTSLPSYCIRAGVCLLAASCFLSPALAMYIRVEIDNVPIERLTQNLEAMSKENPKDAKIHFNLARAHAMAFALKSETAQVRKGQEGEGAWFGFEANHVPFKSVPTEDKERLKAAAEHLNKAIGEYDAVLKLEPTNLPAELGHAWCIDQSGEKEKAVKEYRHVIDDSWKTEKDLKRANLGWHSVTAEAAGYLMPLLDATKDAEEIDTLNTRVQVMRKIPRPVTPIAVPLRPGLTLRDIETPTTTVMFDADGSGLAKRWTWISKDAGWLVYDPQGTKKITSALQMFGGVSFWMFWDNGYEALAALDDNRDGMLSGAELNGLAIWQDSNGDGVCQAGEVKTLAEWGITSLSCRYERDASHPQHMAFSRGGVSFSDGSTRATYDVILTER